MQGSGLRALLASPGTRTGLLGRRLTTALTAVLLLSSVGASALLYRCSLRSARPIVGLFVGATELGSVSPSELDRLLAEEARRFSRGKITLKVATHTLRVPRQELGVRVDLGATRQQILALGKSGNFFRDLAERVRARRKGINVPLAVSLDRDEALEFFIRLKEQVDRLPVPARLDLDRRAVLPARDGYLLRVYDSLAAAELALRRNLPAVELGVTIRRPKKRGERYTDLDISHVLGQFATVYSLKDKDKDRAFNLAVGASKMDGKVIRPNETLSFNDTVGPRNKAQSYRMAPVISEGELVDGMAGGACQLSSTLFAAAFFAGLDLFSSRPHTRPSSYIKMGLDATVAYPTTDLVLKNPYPFPVAIHFKVNQGKVRVRILGKKRPWRKVVFEREIKEVFPFVEQRRTDPTIPRGRTVIAQIGVPGFKLQRRRLFFGKGKEPEKVEQRELSYPPTTQYIREGTGPDDPKWEPPGQHEPFGEVAAQFSLEQ